MSPCMLSHLLRDSSFLSCTNPPLNSTWSNTTLHMYQNTPGLPCTSPECIPSSSSQRKTWICACPCSLAQHSPSQAPGRITEVQIPRAAPQWRLFNDGGTCQQLSSRTSGACILRKGFTVQVLILKPLLG